METYARLVPRNPVSSPCEPPCLQTVHLRAPPHHLPRTPRAPARSPAPPLTCGVDGVARRPAPHPPASIVDGLRNLRPEQSPRSSAHRNVFPPVATARVRLSRQRTVVRVIDMKVAEALKRPRMPLKAPYLRGVCVPDVQVAVE